MVVCGCVWLCVVVCGVCVCVCVCVGVGVGVCVCVWMWHGCLYLWVIFFQGQLAFCKKAVEGLAARRIF